MLRACAFCLLAALGVPAAAADDARPAWFDYDRSVPLAVEWGNSTLRGDAKVASVSFAGRSPQERVSAYLIRPSTPGPHPAVLFVHWLGEPTTTSKQEFLEEAVGLAHFGVISLLIDAMWAEPGWFDLQRYEDDSTASIKQVVQIRRALDMLLSQPGVDPKRLAFVGHDFGAMYGVLAGAADGRPKTYVLLAAAPTLAEWYLLRRGPPKDKAAYLKQMEPLDPVRWVSRLPPASVFFQFSNKDHYVPAPRAKLFFDAAKEPKLSRNYDTGHEMAARDTVNERFRWLAKELALPPAAALSADAGTPVAPKDAAGR